MLKFADWKAEYSVGDHKLDRQHQSILAEISELYISLQSQREERTRELLGFLKRYIETHFATEETVLKKIEYPELEKQQRDHRYFRNRLREIEEGFRLGTDDQRFELMSFLKDWWISHIAKEDIKYAPYLAKKIAHL